MWSAGATIISHAAVKRVEGTNRIRVIFGNHHANAIVIGNQCCSITSQKCGNIRLRIAPQHTDITSHSNAWDPDRQELHIWGGAGKRSYSRIWREHNNDL